MDTNQLIADLRLLGISTLIPTEPTEPNPNVEPAHLIRGLAEASETRLRLALIPVFLRHPELASLVQPLLSELSQRGQQTLQFLYTAAMYLQHGWRTRLRTYLGDLPTIPDLFSHHLKLPAPEWHHGELGLRVLAERQRQVERSFGDWRGDYQDAIDAFFKQLELEAMRT